MVTLISGFGVVHSSASDAEIAKAIPGWKKNKRALHRLEVNNMAEMEAKHAQHHENVSRLASQGRARIAQFSAKSQARIAAVPSPNAHLDPKMIEEAKAAAKAAKIIKRDKRDYATEAGATAAGGLAGQGAYQGAGYGTKHYNLKRNWEKPPGAKHHRPRGLSNSKYDKLMKPVGGKGSVEGMRNMPKEIPGHMYNRVLGYTHRGKLGTAVGTAVTLGGGAAAYRVVRNKEKS